MKLLFGVSCVDGQSRIVCSVYTNLFVFLVLLCVVNIRWRFNVMYEVDHRNYQK